MENILYNNLTIESEKIIQNNMIKIKLKEHQKTAINAMLKFEETGVVAFTKKAYISNYNIYDESHYNRYGYYYGYNNPAYEEEQKKKFKNMRFEIETNYGILADKVGSGKTFMTMGLICYKQVPAERDRIISSSVYTVTRYKDVEIPKKTNLILVPHNLIHQWKVAFQYCNLKTFVISKKAEIEYLQFEENIFDKEPAGPDADFNETNCVEFYDTIIVSSTMFDTFYEKFKSIKWARIIVDEVVSIKLPSDLEFKCNFIWFLTATPSGIRSVRRNYIRTLVSSMTDYTINNIIIKNNDEYVDQSMNLPNLNQILIKCLTPKELNIVKEYVDDEIINMLNAGNIQDAVTKLNCNVETSDNILEVITKKIKKELHNKKAELGYEQSKIPDDKKVHDEKIKRITDKIKELEAKCQGLEERIKSFKEENCPICFGEFDSPMLTPCCNNLFCLQCLTLCKSSCPMCRAALNLSQCTVIDDKKISEPESDTKDHQKEHVLCSKADNLITLLKKKPNGKFLVFSNYDRTFENINQKLNDSDIKHNRLIGSNVVINSIIRRFESGDIRVLMLNALNYGSGLNLQMATDIVIYHELDVELETQVIGRAQRLGRTEPLNVYYLQNDNEKVNCKNPTLSLNIFADDTTMLEKFIHGHDFDPKVDLGKEIDSDDDLEDKVIQILGTVGKVAKAKKPTNKKGKKNAGIGIGVGVNVDVDVEENIVAKAKKKQTKAVINIDKVNPIDKVKPINNVVQLNVIDITDSEIAREVAEIEKIHNNLIINQAFDVVQLNDLQLNDRQLNDRQLNDLQLNDIQLNDRQLNDDQLLNDLQLNEIETLNEIFIKDDTINTIKLKPIPNLDDIISDSNESINKGNDIINKITNAKLVKKVLTKTNKTADKLEAKLTNKITNKIADKIADNTEENIIKKIIKKVQNPKINIVDV